MHAEAYAWVARYATLAPAAVLDIGGRNVNGSPRALFPNADYTALDLLPGEGVDLVADAATWTPERLYDLVLCTEVFEHTPQWRKILYTAWTACESGGRLVLTCAGPGRLPHSGLDGAELRPGEHYANIDPKELHQVLDAGNWTDVQVDQFGPDVRATAICL